MLRIVSVSAFCWIDKGGHYHIADNQQNFVLLPALAFCLPLRAKFIASSGQSLIIITKESWYSLPTLCLMWPACICRIKKCHLCQNKVSSEVISLGATCSHPKLFIVMKLLQVNFLSCCIGRKKKKTNHQL